MIVYSHVIDAFGVYVVINLSKWNARSCVWLHQILNKYESFVKMLYNVVYFLRVVV